MWWLKVLLFLSVISVIYCYNFLGIFPHPSRSHMKFFSGLLDELPKRGHNVTVVSTFPANQELSNYKNIDISRYIPDLLGIVNMSTLEPDSRFSVYTTPLRLSLMADLACTGLASESLRNFLHSNQTFDAVLIEDFNSECYFGIAYSFKVPIIVMSSSGLLSWGAARYGIPDNPATVPNVLLPYSDKMTFSERLENTVVRMVHNLLYPPYRREKDKEYLQRYIGNGFTEFEKYTTNVSLVLVNNHFTLTLARALPPNVIEVGGLHIKGPKMLPNNLKTWIEDSTVGVIYFCMGSMIQGQTINKDKKDAFLNAFDLLPHRILWKYENETQEGISDKILLQKWLPQLDVLCHPNVKLFISHGGLLGTLEAVYCGVPIVVIPQYGDQPSNAAAIQASGGGIVLRSSDITEETVYKTIRKALKLTEQAKALSRRFKDRPLSPLETAIYWTEYVVKHGGAPFMKLAAVDMPFYQYYLLDGIRCQTWRSAIHEISCR